MVGRPRSNVEQGCWGVNGRSDITTLSHTRWYHIGVNRSVVVMKTFTQYSAKSGHTTCVNLRLAKTDNILIESML